MLVTIGNKPRTITTWKLAEKVTHWERQKMQNPEFITKFLMKSAFSDERKMMLLAANFLEPSSKLSVIV